jgi:subtilisin family serine protease
MTTTPETADRPFSYVDKTTGDRKAFTPKPDEAMVTLRPEVSTDALNDVVRETPVLSVSEGYNVEQGYAAVYLDPDADADAAADAVTARPEVTAMLPVMVDEHGASRYFVPGELTVQFRSDVPAERAEQAIADLGSEIVQRQRTPGYYTVRIPEGRDLFAAIDEFAARDDVAFAEPSEVSFNSALVHVPTDADFGLLWGLRNTGQTVNGAAGLAGADIRATDAWDVTRGHPDVVVTVIDTGADLDHPDLAANLLARGTEDWDFANGPDQVPDDEDGHGSHVAGTAAGVENMGGVLGVAPGCRIMPLRVDLTTGQNQNRADAINYVANQALQHGDRRYVINCSWRMNGDHAGVRTAIQTAVRDNVVVVFAAGNANSNTDITPQFPGVYPEVISVAALDQQDARAVFSNFGSNVDVAAPGVNIWSALPNDVHGFLDGTSMAAPHVAGVAALIWSRNRHLTNGQVRSILEETAVSVDAANPGFAGMLGRGRVSALGAVTTPHLFPGLFDHSVRGDLTGDGRADIVGFGDGGVWVSLNQGNGTFGQPQLALENFAYEAGGWRAERHPRGVPGPR